LEAKLNRAALRSVDDFIESKMKLLVSLINNLLSTAGWYKIDGITTICQF
jgi:hypothetical protein